MDPFEQLPSDAYDLILQHLEFEDILNSFLVSKYWHQIISSQKCMEKIKLNLKLWKVMPETIKKRKIEDTIKIVKTTVRKYRSLSVNCKFDENLSQEFWKLLEFLAESLIDLKIINIRLKSVSSMSLPNLQCLRLTDVPIEIRNSILGSCSSLKKLKIKTDASNGLRTGKLGADTESIECIKKFMQRNHSLTDLEIIGESVFKSFFNENISDVSKCQLQSLRIKTDMRLMLITEMNDINIVRFLTKQCNSLKSFYIDTCHKSVILFTFNSMPSLTSFQSDVMIMDMEDYSNNDFNFRLNENIDDLRITYISHSFGLKACLSCAPNLKKLFIGHLTHELMEFIARNLKHLMILKYRFSEHDCHGYYEKLKHDYPEINRHIRLIVDILYH
ncbi:CLUMA_CG011781, isoform A [Clunio marinus]|uniref:CLUMA_CG011781, isoform A n=1 Tax=Clunio marinus TaxID=568069 RepID=A0A1J1IDS3_9DIPT|nr:CLUMA_CG011781, isoform A [Clunio marinus]